MEESTELRDIVKTEEEATLGFSTKYTLKCNQCEEDIVRARNVPHESVIEKKKKEHREQCALGTSGKRKSIEFFDENYNYWFEKIQGLPRNDPRRRPDPLESDLNRNDIYGLFKTATFSGVAKNTIRDRTDLPNRAHGFALGLTPRYMTITIHGNYRIDLLEWCVSKDIEQLNEKTIRTCFTAKLNGVRFIFQPNIDRTRLNCFCTDLAEGFVALRDYCWSLFPSDQKKLELDVSSGLPYELKKVLNIPASPVYGARIYGSEPRKIASFVLQTFGLVNENSYFFVSQKCKLDYTKFHNMESLNIYEVQPLTPDIILTMNNKQTIIHDCQFDVEQIAELLSKCRYYDCGRIIKIQLHIKGLEHEQAEEIFRKTENIIRVPRTQENEACVQNVHSQNYFKVVIEDDVFELSKSQKPPGVKQEPIEEMESVVNNEPIEDMTFAIRDEPIEEVPFAVKQEPIEETESVVRDEPVEEVASVVKDEPIEEVTPSKRRRVE